jgi:tryptophan synthase alpha chain
MLGIFITAGYPDRNKTIKALQILDAAGVDLIELGVPFSDPLADGSVIQKASYEALKQGINLDEIFSLIDTARKNSSNAASAKGLNNVILFSYYNPLYAYGWDRLIDQCLKHKVRGALIPDLPVDEAGALVNKFKNKGLSLTLLAAVTSTDERLKRIAELSEPFVYLVSRTGVTGSAADIQKLQNSQRADNDLAALIRKLKSYTKKPIGLGFGIDSRAKVEEALAAGADMAIVGSKAIKVLEEDQSSDLLGFKSFVADLQGTKVLS